MKEQSFLEWSLTYAALLKDPDLPYRKTIFPENSSISEFLSVQGRILSIPAMRHIRNAFERYHRVGFVKMSPLQLEDDDTPR